MEEIRKLIRRSRLNEAFDLARSRLHTDPDNRRLQYLAVLCLSRAGALEEAGDLYDKFGLADVEGDEDVLALPGRLSKGLMLETTGAQRRSHALDAAQGYERAWEATSGAYAGINTATMYHLAGQDDKAQEIARRVLRSLPEKTPPGKVEAYYHYATKAEAYLLLGDPERAREYLELALAENPKDFGARASTVKQLSLIWDQGLNELDWLDDLRAPAAIQFAGHIFSDNSPEEAEVKDAIGALLDEHQPGFAYGSLAAGSDILWAEQCLLRGVELNVVLPVQPEQFIQRSVIPFGTGWVERFRNCMDAADSLRVIHKDGGEFDDTVTALASEMAMGLAVLRGESLATSAEQWLVFDGSPKEARAGTAADARKWRRTGLIQRIVPFNRNRKPTPALSPEDDHSPRVSKAMVFADIKGYGQLPDRRVPEFVGRILTPISAAIHKLDVQPTHMNTWGDGLFLAFDTPLDAAGAAHALLDTFRKLETTLQEFSKSLSMRISAHYGPVHEVVDPFTQNDNLFGRQVVLAARVEPLTPPGAIYVTEPFASVLALQSRGVFRCDYVGRYRSPKSGDVLPLMSLRRSQTSFNSL